MPDGEESIQWKILAARNGITSKKMLREAIRKTLELTGQLPYKFQRVEAAGVASIDDTSDALPDMFDKQLKLSNLNAVLPSQSPIMDRLKSIFAVGKDLHEALSDTSGNPTERSNEIISQLKGARINELFAHSWGTEAVYLGILNGDIIPPKKLFIVGVPEANEAKWLMLAKYTGIEVHVVGFQWDKLKVAGNMAVKLKSGLPKDAAGLEKLWGERCSKPGRDCADPAKFVRTKFDYNVGVRPPDAPKDEFFKMHLSKLDHERMLYYRHLYDRNLFNKTIDQLDAPQQKLVEAEENRILSAAMDEARSLIAQAKEQAFEQAFKEMTRREQALREAQEVSREQQTPAVTNGIAVTNFVSMLPKVKDFAVASCRSPGEVPLTEDITRPYENIRFVPPVDDQEADRLSSGLGECERRLFRRLIEVIRLGKGRWITDQWIRDTARSYSPPAVSNENRGTVSPPRVRGETTSKRECFIDSNGIRACTVD